MAVPKSLMSHGRNLALATDFYELTMCAGYFESGNNHRATFDLFVREYPPHRSFLLAAGLEQVLHYLMNIRFDGAAISFLRRQRAFQAVSDRFFEYLREFRFTGDVDAIPEGTVFFPPEPILTVTAPIAEAQIVETFLLSTINFETMVASKAARVVHAAGGREVVEFGSRRAHGPQAAVLAARASFIAGCVGTSNVLAARELGIPAIGTAAHSWTMAFDDEQKAFRTYHRVFPESTILLIDTYNTIAGARLAAQIGKKLLGVRLDSGNLLSLSRRVRCILDSAGLREARIVASGDLNEYKIAELADELAPIDVFGVGTEMVTSRDAPSMPGVYKLVEQESGRKLVPREKLSPGKISYPGRKQAYRIQGPSGQFVMDKLCCADEAGPRGSTPLLVPALRRGHLCAELPSVDAIRSRAQDQIRRLPEKYKGLEPKARYPILISRKLEATRVRIARGLARRIRSVLGR